MMSARSQDCSPWTGRGARIAAALAAALIATFLLVLPSQPAAQSDAPPTQAAEALAEMDEEILEAKAENERGEVAEVHKRIQKARSAKFQFIRQAYGNQLLHGCRAGLVILDMELIDGNLARAIAGASEGALKKINLGEARRYANHLFDTLANCAPQREQAIAGQIEDAVARLRDQFDKGKLTAEKVRKSAEGISKLKREIVAGQQIYGCDVLEYFILIESIDKALASAQALPEEERKLRGSLLRKAAKQAGVLIERWRLVPCGGAVPPPEPGPFTAENRLSWYHVNGFGTPPSRECNFVSTSPAQPGAQVTDVITRPNPQPQVTKTATTNSTGDAVISMNIDQTGTYTHQTTVTSQGGVQATDTESQTVTSAPTGANGQCPAPTP